MADRVSFRAAQPLASRLMVSCVTPGDARRQWKSVGVKKRIAVWCGLPLLGVFALTVWGAVELGGWSLAYETLTNMKNPADSVARNRSSGWPYSLCAYTLSAAGWFVVPAVIGAFAGMLVTAGIQVAYGRGDQK